MAFDIDANGIVSVTAKDQATGKEQKITITGSSGLSKDEVDRMVKEAQSHADEDASRREFIDAKNQGDSLAYQVEKTIAEHREKLPVGDLSRVEAAIAEVRTLAEGDDLKALRKATEDLQTASHAIAQALYAKTSNDHAPAEPVNPNVKDAEVVDAEYADTVH